MLLLILPRKAKFDSSILIKYILTIINYPVKSYFERKFLKINLENIKRMWHSVAFTSFSFQAKLF